MNKSKMEERGGARQSARSTSSAAVAAGSLATSATGATGCGSGTLLSISSASPQNCRTLPPCNNAQSV